MGNFRRRHVNKSKGKTKKKPLQKKDENTSVREEQMAGEQARLVVDANAREEEEEEAKNTMVVLRSQDGVELVVSKAEACRYGTKVEAAIRRLDSYDHDAYVHTRSSRNKDYSLIDLSVASSVLSKVIHYSNQQASDPGWDAARLVGSLSHSTLLDLVLAASDLDNRRLLDLTCQTVAGMIDGKSPVEIRHMFGIRPPPAEGPQRRPRQHRELLTPQQKQELKREERALRALNTVRCQDFTEYDPKANCFLPTRLYYLYNFAFFDHDKESEFRRGPPLDEISPPLSESIVYSSVNFISLKVCESDVGFPINLFGTVIARDDVDYRCVYLFRREADDSQIITSPDDQLTLMDPSRALVPDDCIFFEFNLKIKCDGGVVKDFSKGVREFNVCHLPDDKQSMTVGLISWLSSVELLCADVSQPLEASISINILKGTCDLTRVAAWTTANTNDRIILYDSEGAARTQTVPVGNSIALARCVVAVPLDEKVVLHLVVDDDDIEDLELTLGHSDDDHKRVCRMGSGELEVNVAWTAVPRKRKRCKKCEYVGNECLLL